MHAILNDGALKEFRRNGFIRTGIQLSTERLDEIRALYADLPSSASNWSYFKTRCISNHADLHGLKDLRARLINRFAPWVVHRQVRRDIYKKSIYGSSRLLLPVLEDCLAQGLADLLGPIPLLVGHDIFLENDKDQQTFGFHHDGFGWEIFYQTGDDLALYIALQDLNEQSGGRLFVERRAHKAAGYPDRNAYIARFGNFCQEHTNTDSRGLVTREAVVRSRRRRRRRIANEYTRVIAERYALPLPGPEKMMPIDAKAGEVVIFNNKNFHSVEPWKLDKPRRNYIIRTMPLYDLGIAPSATFLNGVPCNRYQLINGRLSAVDPRDNGFEFHPIPEQSVT